MNHKLLLERKQKCGEYDKRWTNLKRLIKFMSEYSSLFVDDDSIAAIAKINEYIEKENSMLHSLYDECIVCEKEVKSTCSHEILIESCLNTYCAICGKSFDEKDISFDHIYIKGAIDSYEAGEISGIINTIERNNEDPIETFQKHSANNQALEKVKVNRRIVGK
jgi:transcription elongation factor Elf1